MNRELGNASYTDKVRACGQSRYALANTIATTAPEDWTQGLLDERQRRLAARVVHLWRSDFA